MKQQDGEGRDVESQVVERVSWNDEHGDGPGRRSADGPYTTAWSDGSEQRLANLARAIESEIIPRLVVIHREATPRRQVHPAVCLAPGRRVGGRPALARDDVVEFTRVVLAHDPTVAIAFMESLQAEGYSLETLYLELVAPAARRLGELWEDDLADFLEVTLALGRLQQVLHRFSDAFLEEVKPPRDGQRILLAPIPGDQHTFGLLMVAEFFRRAGWCVSTRLSSSADELAGIVSGGWFAIVGFSANSESRLDILASSIDAIRRASRNPALGIMVGGPLFVARPELAAQVGADATASDGKQAVLRAETLVAAGALRERSWTGRTERQ